MHDSLSPSTLLLPFTSNYMLLLLILVLVIYWYVVLICSFFLHAVSITPFLLCQFRQLLVKTGSALHNIFKFLTEESYSFNLVTFPLSAKTFITKKFLRLLLSLVPIGWGHSVKIMGWEHCHQSYIIKR